MFEVGFTEIVLIFGIALLVLGPKRLPKLAADVGRWAGRARAMARQLRNQLEQETQYDPLADIQTKPAQTIRTPPPAPAASATATPTMPDPPAAPAQATPDEPKPG
jgi:Tat protein translocase TatB subunit